MQLDTDYTTKISKKENAKYLFGKRRISQIEIDEEE